MALIPGRMTYSFFYVTAFPIWSLLGMLSYSIESEETGDELKSHLFLIHFSVRFSSEIE